MKHIYKYPLTLGKVTHINLGPAAKVVHVAEQGEALMMWVELSDKDGGQQMGSTHKYTPLDEICVYPARRFTLMATGEEIPHGYSYCGTAVCAGGRFVWHLYEVEGEG